PSLVLLPGDTQAPLLRRTGVAVGQFASSSDLQGARSGFAVFAVQRGRKYSFRLFAANKYLGQSVLFGNAYARVRMVSDFDAPAAAACPGSASSSTSSATSFELQALQLRVSALEAPPSTVAVGPSSSVPLAAGWFTYPWAA